MFLGAALKVLLVPAYRSTDFEVHRNWLNVTTSQPPELWYADTPGQSQWTLDYPPAFGLLEFVLAQFVADLSADCLWFQRLSVVVLEALCFPGNHMMGAALVIVDNIHFQYNGFLLGVLLAATRSLDDSPLVAAILFSLLLCLKQLFLTLAPFFAVFLLRSYVGKSPRRFLLLASITLSSLLVGFSPCLLPALLRGRLELTTRELFARLFPFDQRGLVHSYWAPNAWALYVFADTLLLRSSSSASRGRVDATTGFLPQPTPVVCLLLTLAAMVPGLFRTKNPQRGLYHCSLAAFVFGWHVHEKFVLVPLLAIVATGAPSFNARLYTHFARLSTFAVLPLMPPTEYLTALCLVLLQEAAFYHFFPTTRKKNAFEKAHLAMLAGLVALHQLFPFAKYEFLPLMLISTYGALCFSAIFLSSFLSLSLNRPFPLSFNEGG